MSEQWFDEVSKTDWSDMAAIDAVNRRVLEALDADRVFLRKLVDNAVATPELAEMCEHFRTMEKLVLHNDPSGWRLRLHMFVPGHADRPHNHRWNFTSRILLGSYTHTLYGTDDVVVTEEADMRSLAPRLVRREDAGDSYTLHHSMIHTVAADELVVSLIVRGPSTKDSFVVTERHSGKVGARFGVGIEARSVTEDKKMNRETLLQCISILVEKGVIP